MSLLTEQLPDSVCIDGKDCPIRTDFRVWLRFAQLAEDNKINMQDKLVRLFQLVYGYLPPKLDGAIEAALRFYGGAVKGEAARQEEQQKRIFDFEADAEYIYAAFLTQYRLDLCTAPLHWWQFKALLSALDDSTQFMKIIGYRSVELSKIKDPEQRRYYKKMRRLYALPDRRTEREREAAVTEALRHFFD